MSSDVIEIGEGVSIREDELSETFTKASGPGGQNVNKVASAVQLRFDVRNSSLPEEIKHRLIRLAGSRMTGEGALLIRAERFRTLERNRADARQRLAALVRRAAQPPKPRKATRPPASSRKQRLEAKTRRSEVKSARSKPRVDDS